MRGVPRHNRATLSSRRTRCSSSASIRSRSSRRPGAAPRSSNAARWRGRRSTRSSPPSAWRCSSSATGWPGASRSSSTRRRWRCAILLLLVMLPVFPLLFAAYLPGRIRAAAKHPVAARHQVLGNGASARQRHARRRAAVRRLSRLGDRRSHFGQAAHRRRGARGAGGAGRARPTTRSPSSAGSPSTRSSCSGRIAG